MSTYRKGNSRHNGYREQLRFLATLQRPIELGAELLRQEVRPAIAAIMQNPPSLQRYLRRYELLRSNHAVIVSSRNAEAAARAIAEAAEAVKATAQATAEAAEFALLVKKADKLMLTRKEERRIVADQAAALRQAIAVREMRREQRDDGDDFVARRWAIDRQTEREVKHGKKFIELIAA